MEKEFNEKHSIIKFVTMRCPRCGTQCMINHYQELVCPNCGIISNSSGIICHKHAGYIG